MVFLFVVLFFLLSIEVEFPDKKDNCQVVELNNLNLWKIKHNETWIIHIASTYCGGLLAFHSEFKELAEKLCGFIKIGEINENKAERLLSDLQISVLPAVILVKNDSYYEYTGEKDYNSISSWVITGIYLSEPPHQF